MKGKEKVPKHLFLSSFRAPHLKSIQSKTYNLPEDELIGKLEALNGTPQQILNNNDLRKIFLPVIRADFKIAETYQEEVKSKLPLPITCMLGDNDTLKVEEILPWAQYTEADFTYEVFTGDHFYLNTNLQSIVDDILLKLKDEVQI
ncbi:thioesterase II family protein [Bacillus stratosphericus]|uniref:thioesterase II family protein n=1 Tax=Bacillus stratosphericus TaxID=293386 RepID=UPI0035E3FC62